MSVVSVSTPSLTANNEIRRAANGEVVRAIIEHATEAMTHHYSRAGEDGAT